MFRSVKHNVGKVYKIHSYIHRVVVDILRGAKIWERGGKVREIPAQKPSCPTDADKKRKKKGKTDLEGSW